MTQHHLTQPTLSLLVIHSLKPTSVRNSDSSLDFSCQSKLLWVYVQGHGKMLLSLTHFGCCLHQHCVSPVPSLPSSLAHFLMYFKSPEFPICYCKTIYSFCFPTTGSVLRSGHDEGANCPPKSLQDPRGSDIFFFTLAQHCTIAREMPGTSYFPNTQNHSSSNEGPWHYVTLLNRLQKHDNAYLAFSNACDFSSLLVFTITLRYCHRTPPSHTSICGLLEGYTKFSIPFSLQEVGFSFLSRSIL